MSQIKKYLDKNSDLHLKLISGIRQLKNLSDLEELLILRKSLQTSLLGRSKYLLGSSDGNPVRDDSNAHIQSLRDRIEAKDLDAAIFTTKDMIIALKNNVDPFVGFFETLKQECNEHLESLQSDLKVLGMKNEWISEILDLDPANNTTFYSTDMDIEYRKVYYYNILKSVKDDLK